MKRCTKSDSNIQQWIDYQMKKNRRHWPLPTTDLGTTVTPSSPYAFEEES
jgi:hypothetical protein